MKKGRFEWSSTKFRCRLSLMRDACIGQGAPGFSDRQADHGGLREPLRLLILRLGSKGIN